MDDVEDVDWVEKERREIKVNNWMMGREEIVIFFLLLLSKEEMVLVGLWIVVWALSAIG